MRRSQMFATFAAVAAVTLLGSVGGAHAYEAEDAATPVENVPAAVDELVSSIEAAADTYTETSSTGETFAVLGRGIADAGTTLVAGTGQAGALGIGFTLLDDAVQDAATPYLGAVDDPSTVGDLIDPDDVSTILDQLPAASENVKRNGVYIVVDTLNGDLLYAAHASERAVVNLLYVLAGTNYSPVISIVEVPLWVGLRAGREYIVNLEVRVAPVLEELDPVTEPIVEALEDL